MYNLGEVIWNLEVSFLAIGRMKYTFCQSFENNSGISTHFYVTTAKEQDLNKEGKLA